jgi:DNA-directed RNA polymerase
MDTQASQETLKDNTCSPELPQELLKAIDKQDKQDARAERDFGFGTTTRGLAITKRYLGRLTDALKGTLEATAVNQKSSELLKVVRHLPCEVMALSALQSALHSIGKDQTLASTTLALGSALMHECWAHDLTEHSPKLAAKIAKAVRTRHGSLKYRQQAARSAARHAGFQQRFWSRDLQVVAGGWLLGVLLEAMPDAFVLEAAQFGTEKVLTLTPAAMEHADHIVGDAIMRRPYWMPLTEAPRPWTAWNEGGPMDPRYFDNPTFVRSFHKDTQVAVKHAIASGQMAPAVEAVNALQNVAWEINPRILDVINECRARGLEVKGMPPAQNLDLPPPITDEVWEAMDEDAQRVRKMEIGALKQANRSFVGDRLLFAEDMVTATKLATHDRFWTPMNCDWRGRVYGMCHFNFQREDRVRALFRFADGEPIGERGLYWLKVHLANCGDFNKISKRPFKERVEWAEASISLINACSSDPLHDDALAVWTQADKPFLFLAACIELAAAMRMGPEFVTSLPVSFDGSCSGLQHLSAMTRAEEGALVNLTPGELPQDVYETIAASVRVALEAELEKRELAQKILAYGVNRKLSKRNVMTYAYSSKKFGMASQQQEDLMEPLALKVLKKQLPEHPFAPFHKGSVERPSKAARYLAGLVFDTIEDQITKPAQAMKFLQSLAKALAHEGKPLRWTTPVGIPWINRYHEAQVERIELFLYDKGVKVRNRISVAVGAKQEIDKDKAANGVAPNFVHANDAAHLLLVARAASREGITQLATVHDSFGCLASRAERFREVIREEFVRMYEDHDVLTEVLEQAKCDLTQANWNKLPAIPERGALNIKEVLNAEFCFS